MEKNLKQKLNSVIKGKVKFEEPLSGHTTFRIGGPAWAWVEPADTDELRNLILFSRQEAIPLFIIGRGSNILVKDGGLKGIVVSLESENFRKIDFDLHNLTGGSGLKISELLNLSRMLGLGGCEFLSGIPGTLGGAVVMNAGVRNAVKESRYDFLTVGNLVEEVEVMDYEGNFRRLSKRELKFSYRNSNLFEYIILRCTLKLGPRPKESIEKDIEEFLKRKKDSQDLNFPSAGCIFKNPKDLFISAGELIESSGLKGERIGYAQVSRKHANFIINRQDAKAGDVLRLMDLIIQKVEKDHGITLEPEIKIIG